MLYEVITRTVVRDERAFAAPLVTEREVPVGHGFHHLFDGGVRIAGHSYNFV